MIHGAKDGFTSEEFKEFYKHIEESIKNGDKIYRLVEYDISYSHNIYVTIDGKPTIVGIKINSDK